MAGLGAGIVGAFEDQALAQAVAGHLGLFETVLASDGERNLTRETKARVLEERFGRSGFDYAGSDRDDLPVWRRARRGVLVNAAPGVDRAARAVTEVERVFAAQTRLWAELWRAMRPYQWGKNLLVFLPLLTSHRLFDLPLFGRAALGALAFCLCASSVYLLNDLLDLPSDRAHKTKRDRPLAAGRLSSIAALCAIPVLLAASAALAALLPAKFFLTLGVYYALTLAYSLRLRSELVLDVFSLALLYSLRLLGGHVVGDIPYSPWLFGFSLFLFLSLALMKRYIELAASPAVPTHGRGYRPGDAPILKEMGVASAYIAALIFALYINSDQVVRLYARPVWLWALCVIILFALSRMWVLAQRGQVDDDPVRFVLRDRVSWAAAALAAVVLAVAGSVP